MKGVHTYTPAVADGPSDDTPCISLGTDLQREDLGGIQPRNCEPGGSEDGRVQEHEEGGCTANLRAVTVAGVDGCACETSRDEHAYALAYGAPVKCPSTTDSVEREDADQGGKLLRNIVMLATDCGLFGQTRDRSYHVCNIVDTADPETV